jgi:hypothetical protein
MGLSLCQEVCVLLLVVTPVPNKYLEVFKKGVVKANLKLAIGYELIGHELEHQESCQKNFAELYCRKDTEGESESANSTHE